MSTRRKFTFPLATLIRSAELLRDALTDSAYQEAMTVRLGEQFIADFPSKITAVTGKATAQSGQKGDLSQLTAAQQADFKEMERLAAAARRSARQAFPGQDTLLSAEFQVGVIDSQSLSATIARARLTHAAAIKHVAALKTQGWIPADATALLNAINGLAGIDSEQEQAKDESEGLTNEKTIAANTLYADCLAIQNAARLQYPGGTDSKGNEKNITERARFLLNEFPPRDREKPDGETPPAGDETPPAL
jgi:hypothetical protein